MAKAKNLTEQWKAKLAQKQKERVVVAVPVNFAGFEGRACRLSLMQWARSNRLPQYLSTAFFEAVQGKTVEKKRSDLTPEEMAEWLKFQCDAFCAMMIEPSFSTDNTNTDALFYPEFVAEFPEVVAAAIQWQIAGAPDVPVAMADGSEASITEVGKFRRRRKRAATSQSGFNLEGVWWDTKPTLRTL